MANKTKTHEEIIQAEIDCLEGEFDSAEDYQWIKDEWADCPEIQATVMRAMLKDD